MTKALRRCASHWLPRTEPTLAVMQVYFNEEALKQWDGSLWWGPDWMAGWVPENWKEVAQSLASWTASIVVQGALAAAGVATAPAWIAGMAAGIAAMHGVRAIQELTEDQIKRTPEVQRFVKGAVKAVIRKGNQQGARSSREIRRVANSAKQDFRSIEHFWATRSSRSGTGQNDYFWGDGTPKFSW